MNGCATTLLFQFSWKLQMLYWSNASWVNVLTHKPEVKCLFAILSVCLSVRASISLGVCFFVRLYRCVSVSLCVSLSAYQSVCLYLCVSISLCLLLVHPTDSGKLRKLLFSMSRCYFLAFSNYFFPEIYHVTFEPPENPEISRRLVTIDNQSEKFIRKQLIHYHR